jgi:uncharacterized protein
MLVIVSSSKTLDFSKSPNIKSPTIPVFINESEELIGIIRQFSVSELMKLLKISKSLAEINFNRFKKWNSAKNLSTSKIALLAFKGDVFENIKATSLTASDFEFANRHLKIISGLYGLLRPLDNILPYRLEMGTKLENEQGNNLYHFWKNKITYELNKSLVEKNHNVILNLASNEYFKVIDTPLVQKPILNISFLQKQSGTYKNIGLYSKKARGHMVNFIIKNRITKPNDLKAFCEDHYIFNSHFSNEKEWVYTR